MTTTVDTTTAVNNDTNPNPELDNALSYELSFIEHMREFLISALSEETRDESWVSHIETEIGEMNIESVYTHQEFDLLGFINSMFLDWGYERETTQHGHVYQFCTGTGGPEHSFWLTESGWRSVSRNWFTHGDIQSSSEIAGFMDHCLQVLDDGIVMKSKAEMIAQLQKLNYTPDIEEGTFTVPFIEWAEWRNNRHEVAMEHSDMQRRLDNGEMWHVEFEITDVLLDKSDLVHHVAQIDCDVTACEDSDEVKDPIAECFDQLEVTVSYRAKVWADHPPADWDEDFCPWGN